jgi:hypothetical protein
LRPIGSIACCLVVALSTVACARDPNVKYARLLERAASWASAVQFTNELAQDRRVPMTYVRDAVATASKELAAIRAQIAAQDTIAETARHPAVAWCARLTALFEEAGAAGTIRDAGEVREIEGRLRAAARDARAGDVDFRR